MKQAWVCYLLIGSLLSTIGLFAGVAADNPEDSEFPGGYIGFGIHYGFDRTIGVQVSLGVAVPSVGEPGVGPYLFPALAFGLRKSPQHKTSYRYIDLQVTYFTGFWGGLGIGQAFSSNGNYFRYKWYGGYLIAGATYEAFISNNQKKITPFKGVYLGLPLPLIGSHLYP